MQFMFSPENNKKMLSRIVVDVITFILHAQAFITVPAVKVRRSANYFANIEFGCIRSGNVFRLVCVACTQFACGCNIVFVKSDRPCRNFIGYTEF